MNVRWATYLEQAQNKNSGINKITYKGETHTLKDWADKLNIPRTTLSARIKTYKWGVEKSFTTPVNLIGFKYQGKTIPQWAKLLGISVNTLNNRYFGYGWSVERTINTPVRKRKQK